MAATNLQPPPPFFSTLSLNTQKMADLAGLVAILRESRPDLVFLQEVNLSLDRLKAVVGGLGYSAWLSTCHTPK